MTAKRIQTIETSAELPVDSLYNQALNGIMDTHAQLAKLPQDKNDPLESLDFILRDLGVDMGTDYGMFLMGAMGNVALDMGLQAAGAASPALATGLDVAGSMLMDSSQSKAERRNAPVVSKTTQKSVFSLRPKFRRAHEAAPKKPQAATTLMKNALARPGLDSAKKTASKRKSLRRQLEIYKDNIRELAAFKSCGVKYARRVTVPNGATGETETYLVASADKPDVAFNLKGKPIDVSMCRKPGFSAPRFGMAA